MKIFSFVLLFYSSLVFSYEIPQGTLSNGISYYLCPNIPERKNISITVVVKRTDKEQKFEFFPFFQEVLGASSHPHPTLFALSESFICFNIDDSLSELFGEEISINHIISQISKFLECPEVSSRCIKEMRKEFMEDLDDEDSQILFSKALETDFVISKESGFDDFELDEALFWVQSNDEIRNDYRTLFTTSPIAIIIEGSFDPNEFESLLGGISRPNVQSSTLPMVIENKIAYYYEDEESLLYEYEYSVEPTFRDQTLKDLLRMVGYQADTILPESCLIFDHPFGNLSPTEFLCSRNKISNPDCYTSRFDFAKSELAELYQRDRTHQWIRCVEHFVSGISQELTPDNQNLMKELNSLSIDEFHAFILKHFSNVQYLPFPENSY